MDVPIAERMRALADALARDHAGLDGSVASIHALDALAADTGASAPPTPTLGAYLGEVVRRAAPTTFAWALDGETPVLVAGSARWHPVDKVEKRRRGGRGDDLTAFVGVVLAMTPGAAARMNDADERVRVEAGRAVVEKAAKALRAEPSNAEHLWSLERNLFGHLSRKHHADALRAIGLRPDEVLPHLGAPATGRGYERRHPGAVAAGLVAYLVELGLAPRDAVVAALRVRLRERDKTVRTHVAQALAQIDLVSGSTTVALELGRGKDRAHLEGVLSALRSVAGRVRHGDDDPPVTLAAITPLLVPALAPASPHAKVALDVVNGFSFRPEHRAEARGLVPALEKLGSAGKPEAARLARDIASRARHAREGAKHEPLRIFATYVYATVEGDASYTTSNARMSILRELMREVGAVAEAGVKRALPDGPPVDPAAPALGKLVRPSREVVTPTECTVIARRLRGHLDVVHEVASFFDDAPEGPELVAWVSAWADFNERAAALGGYRQR